MQEQLMDPPNSTWRNIIDQAAQQSEILKESEVIKNVQNILQTNVSVCSSLGHPFLSQMSRIYTDMLKFYRQASAPADHEDECRSAINVNYPSDQAESFSCKVQFLCCMLPTFSLCM